jgi:hypothetical protein
MTKCFHYEGEMMLTYSELRFLQEHHVSHVLVSSLEPFPQQKHHGTDRKH